MKKLLIMLFISGSTWAQTDAYFGDFSRIVSVEDREQYYNEKRQMDTDEAGQYDDYLTSLAIDWLKKGDIEKYRYYMESNPNISFISLVNLVYALEHLEEDDNNAAIVEEVSSDIIKKTVSLDDEMSKGRLQVILEINAMANAKLGNVDQAIKNIEKANQIEGDRGTKYFKDSKANYYNRYGNVLLAAGKDQQALDTLTRAVRNADSNALVAATLKEAYKGIHGEKGADDYVASLKDEAYKKYYKEVEKMYRTDASIPHQGSVPSPTGEGNLTVFNADKHIHDISMVTMDDQKVNFADSKDKILVIDFWTTGCTPCVAAFAGFDKVVEDYSQEELQLYVINIFEEQPTVKSFVARKGITLDVLLDQANEAYDIKASPTKIVFDPIGNIRFYSIGYAGSTDREYYKLKAMVEIVKSNA